MVLPTQWAPTGLPSASDKKTLSYFDSSFEDNINWNSLLLKWHNQLCTKVPSACSKDEYGLYNAALFVVEELERSNFQQAINNSTPSIMDTKDSTDVNAAIANSSSFSDIDVILASSPSQYSIYQIVILAFI